MTSDDKRWTERLGTWFGFQEGVDIFVFRLHVLCNIRDCDLFTYLGLFNICTGSVIY